MRTACRLARRAAVLVLGTLVLLVGVAMLVLPGPGWLVTFAGLGVLGTELPWAARLLQRAQSLARRWWASARASGSRRQPQP